MNCIEFKQYAHQAPAELSPEARAHAAECVRCQECLSAVQQADRTLKQAMRLTPSSDLAARAMVRAVAKQRHVRQTWAVAASVLLMVTASLAIWWQAQSPNVEQLLVDHILHEISLLAPTDQQVSIAQVNQVLDYVAVDLDQDLANVRHAGICLMNGQLAAHFVVGEAGRPLTIMIMPEQPIESMRQFEAHGFGGYIMPHQNGSMAIVGRAQEQAEQTKQLAAQLSQGEEIRI